MNTTISIFQPIMNNYQLKLNRSLLNPIQIFLEEEGTISITQTFRQSTNVIVTTISILKQKKIITSIWLIIINTMRRKKGREYKPVDYQPDGNNKIICNKNIYYY